MQPGALVRAQSPPWGKGIRLEGVIFVYVCVLRLGTVPREWARSFTRAMREFACEAELVLLDLVSFAIMSKTT